MKNKEIISKGAEAIILKSKNGIIKERIKKNYRIPELDEKIRKQRTRKEIKILEKASKIINVPKILSTNEKDFLLEMEYLGDQRLSEKLDKYPKKEQQRIMKDLGNQLGRLHDKDIIHGDLTTSNTILKEKKVYIIDFGLGFISTRIEDRAVDIYLIKQALEAKHWKNYKELFSEFLEGYKISKNFEKVINQLKKVESRGRYKH
jgi:TP53 regulating kinase and related kinases